MGEVYRARDARLGREVALKVLPKDVAEHPARRQRFEREARAAGALNHPNVVSVYDVGDESGTFFIVSELVEGESLRALIQRGPIPIRKLLDIGAQVADGLAAAHGAGITHRDLKPENVMLSREGRVKLLDFGLAKQRPLAPEQEVTATVVNDDASQPGMIVGTVSYMSPEQVRAEAVDFRSDQFSFGLILYELATGRQAFRRDSSVQTMSAILTEEPPPITTGVPQPLRWIIDRCLSKDPADRFASTTDLFRDLKDLRDHLSEFASSGAVAAMTERSRRSRDLSVLAAVLLLAAVAAAGTFAGKAIWKTEPPSFKALTFRRGSINSARFAPDGKTIVYGAAWGGEPVRTYISREGSPETTPLGGPNSTVYGISSAAELAISLGFRYVGGFIFSGTLARSPLTGGGAREVLENVNYADWSPDGTALAIVRETEGRSRLEFPIGKPLYETAGWISHPRIAPDGRHIAFLDHPVTGDDGGMVSLVDVAGSRRVLSDGWLSEQGLAWPPSGNEVWFTATRAGGNRALHAVSLSGKERLLAHVPGSMTLHDISRAGKVLISRDTPRMSILASTPGQAGERDLSWLDWSLLRDLSDDGSTILFDETGEGGGAAYSVYVRKADGSPAVRLGDGVAMALSRDGKWALSISRREPQDTPLRLLPTGPGAARPLPLEGAYQPHFAVWFPDGKRILLLASEPGKGRRMYVVESIEGVAPVKPRAITPEAAWGWPLVSPDGKFIVAREGDVGLMRYPVDGGEPQRIHGALPDEVPVQWTSDGRSFYVVQRTDSRIYRLDLATGERRLWKEIAPSNRIGLISPVSVFVTPDGKAYAYSLFTTTSELYLVEGLK